jgi:hypothetical protein
MKRERASYGTTCGGYYAIRLGRILKIKRWRD